MSPASGQTQFADISFLGLSRVTSLPPELRIKRQNSSDSISSLNSITSHSSIGSSKDADAKKKKKKSWVGWPGCWQEKQGLGSAGRVWPGSAPRANCSRSALALWCWSPLSLGDSTGEDHVATMDLCLDVLSGTAPAPLGVSQPWSRMSAPSFFPHISLLPTQALAAWGAGRLGQAAPSLCRAALTWTRD